MRTVEWDRQARIADVRDRIWLYVSPASQFEPSALLVAAALLKLPETDLRRLGELQFVLSEEVGQFLAAMPRLVRQLATSSTREEQWTAERLHGASPVEQDSGPAIGHRVTAPVRHITGRTRLPDA